MKKIKFLMLSFMALFIALGMTGCSKEDEPNRRIIQRLFKTITSTFG